MVASRCGQRLPSHPLISRSTSRSVRYSRVLTSAFFGRRGVTFRFTVSGDTIFRNGFGIRNNAPVAVTFGKVFYLRKVCKRAGPTVPAGDARAVLYAPTLGTRHAKSSTITSRSIRPAVAWDLLHTGYPTNNGPPGGTRIRKMTQSCKVVRSSW